MESSLHDANGNPNGIHLITKRILHKLRCGAGTGLPDNRIWGI
jgi:hypothetical protein